MSLPNNLNELSQGELIRIIYDQRDRIEALEIRLAEIQERLNDQGPKPTLPLPSWVKPNVKSKNNAKRKKRDHGYARKLDVPTKQVFHSYDYCPDCGGWLGKPSVETGGRENGKNGYHWSFSNRDVHFLLYKKSRSREVVEEILGDEFTDVLSTD